jgi:alkanesulfonate monooxygenase SsuD/methylene tetrahydromethanopterin reductase-like flavin-dependent oxidoreductase (luciferase family)
VALELGVFLPVANNGWILSPSAPPAPPTFALNRAIADEAERRGYHFLLGQSVWRGHGAAAAAEVQRYRDDPDTEAVADLVGEYSRDGAGASLRSAIVDAGEHVFFGGVVAGSAATVAAHVAGVAEAGLDGLLVIFTDWFGGMVRFSDDVLARLPGLVAGPEVDWAVPAPIPV